MPRRKAQPNNNNDGESDAKPMPAKRSRIAFHLELPTRRTTLGNVLVCGMGDIGQLGLGEDVMERKRLTLVEDIPDAVDICAGGVHNLVLTKNGDIYSFGCNDEGALGRDTSEEGSESRPALVELPGKALRISAGDSHSACILEDGRVYAWGSFRDSHGNMGLTIDGNKRMPINLLDGQLCNSIASGADHLVILTTTGKVYTVGCAEQGQLGRISERSVGGEGRRGKRDLLLPAQVIVKRTKPMEAIWATNFCTFMRESSTQIIWGVGLNNFKQLAHEKETDRVLIPLKTDLKDVKQITGGIHHTIVLTTDLKCSVVGRPDYGRLGLGPDIKDVVSKLTPVTKLKEKIVYVGCGEICSYAITEDGKLYSWGLGSNSQLGIGDGDDEVEPVLVASKNTQNKRILLATGGGQHAICLVEAEEQAAASSSNGQAEKSPAGGKKAEKDKATQPKSEKDEKPKKPAAKQGSSNGNKDKSPVSQEDVEMTTPKSSDKSDKPDQPEKDEKPKKAAAKRGPKKT
ncbi:hypothetical protein KR059_008535 [Drosophila kikkawai]|nr:hypothetical protein KR059_008535 [Drosophila kikkawai]